jgi:hypothetical protein
MKIGKSVWIRIRTGLGSFRKPHSEVQTNPESGRKVCGGEKSSEELLFLMKFGKR